MNQDDGLYHKTYTCPRCGVVLECSSLNKKSAVEKLQQAFAEHNKKCRECFLQQKSVGQKPA